MSKMSIQSIHIITIALMVLLNQHYIVDARPNYRNYYMQKYEIPQIALEDSYYTQGQPFEANKLDPNDPNFLQNWPYLREILPPMYETSTNKLINEILSQNGNRIDADDDEFIEILPTPLPLQRMPSKLIPKMYKDQNEKKSSNSNRSRKDPPKREYMSSCHFKICNMGRKRDLRYHQY